MTTGRVYFELKRNNDTNSVLCFGDLASNKARQLFTLYVGNQNFRVARQIVSFKIYEWALVCGFQI